MPGPGSAVSTSVSLLHHPNVTASSVSLSHHLHHPAGSRRDPAEASVLGVRADDRVHQLQRDPASLAAAQIPAMLVPREVTRASTSPEDSSAVLTILFSAY